MAKTTITAEHGPGGVPQFDLHDRLRKAREWAGMEQGELAGALDVSRNTIGNYETRATTRLKPLVLKQWAMRTGVPYEWLLTGEVPAGPDDGETGGPGRSRTDDLRGVSTTLSVVQGPWPLTASAGPDEGRRAA